MSLERVSGLAVDEVRAFLRDADLTLAGIDESGVRLWIERGEHKEIIGSTGFELSEDGVHALIRSVAVSPNHRVAGMGSCLARYAMSEAWAVGATQAWLFSRRSGPFWQKLGFTRADRNELVAVLPDAHQVQLFVRSGQLEREAAWFRSLPESPR